MSHTPRILVFAGSARKESFNKKLAAIAADAARAAGAEVTHLDLAEYPMPIYDGDLEAADGMPENAKKLKQLFIDHDALLIASPEYNSSFSPLLKNVIDWVSRGEGGLIAYKGKVAGLLAASPGALGGLRGLVHLRSVLGNIGVLVLSNQRAVNASALDDPKTAEQVAALAKELVDTVAKLKA